MNNDKLWYELTDSESGEKVSGLTPVNINMAVTSEEIAEEYFYTKTSKHDPASGVTPHGFRCEIVFKKRKGGDVIGTYEVNAGVDVYFFGNEI